MSRNELHNLTARLAARQAAHAERLTYQRRGGPRQPGTRGGVFPQKISTSERVLLTVLYLRKRCTLDVLADALDDVSRSAIGGAVRETQPLLQQDGYLPPPASVRYRRCPPPHRRIRTERLSAHGLICMTRYDLILRATGHRALDSVPYRGVDAAESADATRGQAPGRAGDRTRRRAAHEAIAAYHQARLDELVSHMAAAVDAWREGSLDVYDVDEVLHRYQRAARELWKFCWGTGGGHVEWVADQLRRLAADHEAIDWWERGAPHRRSNPTR